MEPLSVRFEKDADTTVLLWDNTETGKTMRIAIDSAVVPHDQLVDAVRCMDCEGYDGMMVANIRWHRISSRVSLQILYETLVAHGIPVFPCMADALSGWDGQHAAAAAAAPPTAPCVALPPEVTEEAAVAADPQQGHHKRKRDAPQPHNNMAVVAANNPTTTTEAAMGLFATGVHSIQSLLELVNADEDEPMFSHLWVVGSVCRFPLTLLQTCHATMGMDLCERVSNLSPKAIVRSYSLGNVIVPLLVWYRSYRTRVVSMIQEYLHIVYSHVREVRVWHYSLIPHSTPIHLVAHDFRCARILPSWNGLCDALVLDDAKSTGVPFGTLEVAGSRLIRDPDRRYMHTEYENPACPSDVPSVMWFGNEVFFYVTLPVGTPGCNAVAHIRPPANHGELPPWVAPLLQEQLGVSPTDLKRNIDRYLSQFQESSSPVLRMFRRINWATLPLFWQPTHIKNLPLRVTRQESEEAQIRLVQNMKEIMQDVTQADADEAVRLLGRITGVLL